MQVVGMIAIGFVFGVLVTVLFGKRIAAAAVADAKAVAFDAGRVINDATGRFRSRLDTMGGRIYTKLDVHAAALKADVANAPQEIAKKL